MTNREFYEAIVKANVNDELTAFAQTALEKLDNANLARKEAAAKKAIEREAERAPIREAIVACITDEPKTATSLIAEAGVEIKPQAMPSLLRALVEAGEIERTEIKVKGKGKQIGYRRV